MPILHCRHGSKLDSKYVKIKPKQGFHTVKENRWHYEGDWKDNQKHGFGLLSKKTSRKSYDKKYQGNWKENFRSGEGNGFYTDGGYYTGEWRCGKRHGYGSMWYPDGSFYDGDWKNGTRYGLGLFVMKNGNRYEGQWENDVKEGFGMFLFLNTGQMMKGLWQNDKAVCTTMQDIPFRQTAVFPTEYPIVPTSLVFWEVVLQNQLDAMLLRLEDDHSTELIQWDSTADLES